MERLSLPREALDNTLWIADQVEDYQFDTALKMPEFPEAYSKAEGLLRHNALKGLHAIPWYTNEYEDRMNYELDVICTQGFPSYFLVLADIIAWARSHGIGVGPGRGSAAGSLVAFLVGITEVDPIVHGLLFERFLNADRVSLPDVDIDFESGRRDEVIAYATEKYGAEYVARICAIGTIGAKKALKDSARVLGRSFEEGTQLTWALPRPEFGRMPALSECDMSKIFDSEVFGLAERLEGLARAPGVHAGGFVISPVPLTDVLPLWLPERKNDAACTQWDMHAVEALGLVKYDFLAVTMVGILKQAARTAGITLSVEDLNDEPTYALLRRGETLGVFQLDGGPMRGLLRRLAPRKFEHLAATLALYRPGPMGSGAHHQYADRLNRKQGVSYPHPEFADALKDILGPTFGVILYQEQVMQILQRVCGYSLSQADLVRKAMGKKDRELLAGERERFFTGGLKNGYSRAALSTLWEILIPFADYSFGKGHAVGYGILAYWGAFLKVHHGEHYMSALLSHEDENDKISEYIAEIRRMGIRILPPSVNESQSFWTPTKEGIRYGASSIKGVGAKVVGPILSGAPYRDWADYLRRTPAAARNSGVVKALIQSGGMDCFGSREGLLHVYERHLEAAKQEREELRRGEVGLVRRSFEVPQLPISYGERARAETATLGATFSSKPVIFQVPKNLGQDDWNYIQSAARSCAGGSPVTFACGPWIMSPAIAVDPERFARSVAPLGVTLVD